MYDSTQRFAFLKQTDYDMVSYVVEAQAVVEKLKMFLEGDSMEEVRRKNNNLYMVMIPRGANQVFNHIHVQVLIAHDVPSVEDLVTQLLHVPTQKNKVSSLEVHELSAMVSSRGRGRGGYQRKGGQGRGRKGKNNNLWRNHFKTSSHTQDLCYDLNGFLEKTIHVSKFGKSEQTNDIFEEKYQEYLLLKTNNQAHSSSTPSVSTACISQFVEGQGPWVIDLGVFYHIADNDSLFPFMSS